MVAMEIGKRLFFSYHSNGCHEEKCFIKNLNLIDLNYDWKNWVDWISAKVSGKVKHVIILYFMTTLHIFAFRIQIGWATRVVRPNLKIRSVTDRC